MMMLPTLSMNGCPSKEVTKCDSELITMIDCVLRSNVVLFSNDKYPSNDSYRAITELLSLHLLTSRYE